MLDGAGEKKISAAIMAIAIALGAYLRFANLGAREMSADEGASWAAAAARSAGAVLRLEARLNPGKLGVHDLALHAWMRLFGDSLVAMRSLSALVGTLSIPLIFAVALELIDMPPAPESPEPRAPARIRALAPAFTAIFFAANLIVVKYAREARMYPIALAFGLVQVWFFLRAWRLGGLLNYAVCAISAALAIATNFSMGLLLLPEGIWLLAAMARTRSAGGRPLRIGIALAAGLTLLVPAVAASLRARGAPIHLSVISWISRPAPWAPIALFNKASGTFAFPIMAGLAAWGAMRGWREARAGVIFALLWMFAAPIALLAISYAIQPAFVERYVLACFAPFFILVALGAATLESNAMRLGAAALAVALALGHVASYDRKPHDAQWREAVTAAVANTPADGAITVAPPYAVNVARYYLRDWRDPPAAYSIRRDAGDTAIIAHTGVPPAEIAELSRRYPHPLASVRGVMVRRR